MTKRSPLIVAGLFAFAFATILSFAPAPVSAADGFCQCPGSTQMITACNNVGGPIISGNCGAPFECPNQADLPACVAGSSATNTPSTGGTTKLENPLAGACKGAEGQVCVQRIIGNVIKAALGIVGSIALLMMIYGGILWLTSAGNTDRVTKGKNVLIWAVLGLIIIFAGYAITSYVVTKLST